jgi:hypothetical protein
VLEHAIMAWVSARLPEVSDTSTRSPGLKDRHLGKLGEVCRLSAGTLRLLDYRRGAPHDAAQARNPFTRARATPRRRCCGSACHIRTDLSEPIWHRVTEELRTAIARELSEREGR